MTVVDETGSRSGFCWPGPAFNCGRNRQPVGLGGLPGKWELTVTPVAERES